MSKPAKEKEEQKPVTWVEQMQRSRKGPAKPVPGPATQETKKK